jgi:hypothetical protein
VNNTRHRAEAAIRELDKQGWPATFASVAAATSVSRSWLCRQPDIRAEFDRLRARRGDDTIPSVERASADSTKRQREDLLDELTILKEENRRLREEVARAYGQQRASVWWHRRGHVHHVDDLIMLIANRNAPDNGEQPHQAGQTRGFRISKLSKLPTEVAALGRQARLVIFSYILTPLICEVLLDAGRFTKR